MTEPRIEELRAQARYAQDRLSLYQARAYAQRPVDPSRLRDLERAAASTAQRLRHTLEHRTGAQGADLQGS